MEFFKRKRAFHKQFSATQQVRIPKKTEKKRDEIPIQKQASYRTSLLVNANNKKRYSRYHVPPESLIRTTPAPSSY